MSKLVVSGAPHITDKASTQRIMIDVLIALLPATVMSIVIFGWRALAVVAVAVASAVAAEFVYGIVAKKKDRFKNLSIKDCSAAVTGLLVALNVPSTLPLWMVALGSVFAIVIVKMLFGGLGKNFANPAMTARLFLLISFAQLMSQSAPTTGAFGMEIASGATWLANRLPEDVAQNVLGMILGNKASCAMGEVSIVALLVGYAYLCVRKVIDWKMPLVIIGGVALFALLFDALPNHTGADIGYVTLGHVLSGGVVLGAVFMATDYATSPNTTLGSMIYALAIALLTVVIRVFGSYPEGMSCAIVLMNILTPVIDKLIVPKPFGYVKPEKQKKGGKA